MAKDFLQVYVQAPGGQIRHDVTPAEPWISEAHTEVVFAPVADSESLSHMTNRIEVGPACTALESPLITGTNRLTLELLALPGGDCIQYNNRYQTDIQVNCGDGTNHE